VIGGYNNFDGVLDSFETFSIRSRKWELSDETQKLNKARINAAACKCGDRYVYVFGGLSSEDEFLDQIERYNTQLKIWTVMDVKLPQRMTNHFSFSFNPNYIIILGGLLKKAEQFIPSESKKIFELQDRVFILKTKNLTWKELKPFPFKKKLGQVVYNNHGKFFCFVVEANSELPSLFVYDVRSCFPQFNKYWEHEAQQRDRIQKIKGKHIQIQQVIYNPAPQKDE